MNQEQVLELFGKYDAYLEGHFLLTSGLHSPHYFQCARVLQHPQAAEEALQHDDGEERVGKAPHAPTPLPPPENSGNDKREKAHLHARETMRVLGKLVLVLHPPGGIQGSVRQGPVEKGHAGPDAGGEPSREKQDRGPDEGEENEPEAKGAALG